MNINEFVKQYGTATTSLTIRWLIEEMDKSSNYHKNLAVIAEELATNLQCALESVK